jgi:hypothetical protein
VIAGLPPTTRDGAARPTAHFAQFDASKPASARDFDQPADRRARGATIYEPHRQPTSTLSA